MQQHAQNASLSNNPFGNGIDFTSPAFSGDVPTYKTPPKQKRSNPGPKSDLVVPEMDKITGSTASTSEPVTASVQTVAIPELPEDITRLSSMIQPYEPIQLSLSNRESDIDLGGATLDVPTSSQKYENDKQPEHKQPYPSQPEIDFEAIVTENQTLKHYNKTLMEDIGEHTRLIQFSKKEITNLRSDLKTAEGVSQRARKILINVRKDVETFKDNYKRILTAREKHIYYLEAEVRRLKMQQNLNQELQSVEQMPSATPSA